MKRFAFRFLFACLAGVVASCGGGGGGGGGSTPARTSYAYITSFNPTSGLAGSSVTIYGSNFSATVAGNTVAFNGVTATVTSASATQVVATVPASATTGLISVATSNGTAYSTNAFTVTTASLPAAPSSVSATAGAGQNSVSWNASSGATSYNIYWSTTSGAGKSGTKIAGVTSPYTHSGLTAGTPYYYVVTAVNSAGESSASSQTSASPKPLAPTGVSAAAGNAQNTISWSAATGATSYNLYWSTTSGAGASGTKIAGATSPYTHAPLSNGTTYYYVVTAVNASGESPASTQVSAMPAVTAPTAPTGVSATAGNLQNTISWSAVSSATSYNLYWSTTTGVTTLNGTQIAGVTSGFAHSGLGAGTPYYYIVTAVNSAGESAASSQVSATPLAALPSVPSNVAAVAGNAQITLSWSAATGASSYNVYRSTTSGAGTGGTKFAGVTSPLTQTGLTNATTYYYVVTAVNSAGESSASAQVGAVPSTPNTWTTAASITNPQAGSASGVINGILYVVGGSPPSGYATTAMQAYDPATNSWTTKASALNSRAGAGSAVINGKLYVVGGCIDSDCRIGTTSAFEVYDPGTNTWSSLPSMPTPRYQPSVAVINGILYVAGGGHACPDSVGQCGSLTVLEAYDPVGNTWTTKASMPSVQAQGAGAAINGIFYSVGGYDWNANYIATVNAYDPTSNTWTAKANMPTARNGLNVYAVNGILYAVGGSNLSGFLGTVEAYDPGTNTWSTKASMPTARYGMGYGVLNGRLYAVSGYGASGFISVTEVYAP